MLDGPGARPVHFAPLRGARSAEMAKTPNPTNLIRLIPAEEEPNVFLVAVMA
jgi:hypothetical protein